MTGIERLRKLSEDLLPYRLWNVLDAGTEEDWDCHEFDFTTVGDVLGSIADQIERETKTSSEVEKMKCDPDDVSMSAYGLLPADEREAIAWVREHGGLDAVRRMFQDADSRRVELCGALGIDLDKGWSEAMAAMRRRLMPEGCEWPHYESDELVLIGDDVIGPDYGESIHVDEITFHANGFTLREKTGLDHWYESDDRFERPAVLAADGEPLEVGQTVWDTNGDELVIGAFEDGGHTVTCRYAYVGDGIPVHGMWSPSDLTHQRPVLDADGNRIEPAMDVWWVCEGDERGVHAEKLHVESIGDDGLVTCDPFNGGTWVELEPSELYVNRPVLDAGGVPIKVGDTVYDTSDGTELVITSTELDVLDHVKASQENPTKASVSIHPLRLTHAKPEPPDSWERIEEDAKKDRCSYFGAKYQDCGRCTQLATSCSISKARDLVRRCRALAERERGE